MKEDSYGEESSLMANARESLIMVTGLKAAITAASFGLRVVRKLTQAVTSTRVTSTMVRGTAMASTQSNLRKVKALTLKNLTL